MSTPEACKLLGVSQQMLTFRINMSGAKRRAQRRRHLA